MNLPNKLTLSRVILVPFFVALILIPKGVIPCQNRIAFAIYCVASLTDAFDGAIARKYNMVTNFGKFMDPLADKLLVCSALICFVKTGQIAAWIVLIIIGREFIISGFRLIACEQGIVIAAGIWGKIKTIVQMIMIGVLLIFVNPIWQASALDSCMYILEQVLIYASLVLSLVSLGDYMIRNRNVIQQTK